MTKKKKRNLKTIILSILSVFVLAFSFIPSYSANAYTLSTDNNTYNPYTNTWFEDTRSTTNFGSNFNGNRLWTDNNGLYSTSSSSNFSLVFDHITCSFIRKDWNGLSTFEGQFVWNDSEYNYLSNGQYQYRKTLDGNTWSSVSWSGLSTFYGDNVWTDGVNYYYSYGLSHYIKTPGVLSWQPITFTVYNFGGSVISSNFDGEDVWTDGVNVYVSYDNDNYLGVFDFTDNSIRYVSSNILRPNTSTSKPILAPDIWTDGVNVYYSNSSNSVDNLIWDRVSRTWSTYDWGYGLSSIDGRNTFNFCDLIYTVFNGKLFVSSIGIYNKAFELGKQVGYTDGYTAGYNAGLINSSVSDSYDAGYNSGYNAGVATNSGYSFGYDAGYSIGYDVGYSQGSNISFDAGRAEGYNNGYTDGYTAGIEDTQDYTFFGLIAAVIDAPIQAFTGLFDFNLFGVNLKSLFLALFTACVIIVIVKICLGGR